MIKPYEENNPTKNFWYPEVPSHWVLSKVKYVAKTIAGGTPSTDKSEYWENGDIPWLPSGKLQNCDITTAEKFITKQGLDNSSTKLIKPCTTLIALTGATCSNIGFLKFQACANQSVVAINEFSGKADSRFLFYMFLSMRKQILTHQSGGAQAGINDGNVKNLFLVVPPLNEQTKIAQYLDHQTSIIDQLILQKEKLIELLKEKRQAVINEAVTKGLNPNAKMKDSGIEWLGEVPNEWIVIKLKHVVGYIKGFAFKTEVFREEGVPIVKASDIKNLTIKSGKDYISKQDSRNYDKVRLFEGDIIISTVGSTPDVINSAVGQIAKVPIEFQGSCLNQNTVKFYPSTVLLLNDFLFYLLNTNRYRKYLDLYAHGTANQASLKIEDMLDFTAVLPSISEQEQIIVYLEKKIHQVQNLLEINLNCIEKLKEFRQSVISEAVTGKIDVRDWQPKNLQNN